MLKTNLRHICTSYIHICVGLILNEFLYLITAIIPFYSADFIILNEFRRRLSGLFPLSIIKQSVKHCSLDPSDEFTI